MVEERVALVISDIDGTLITSNHELTAETRRVARELAARAIPLALASSRPPRGIFPIAAELGLETPFAAFNGGLIVKPEGEVIAGGLLEPATIARVRAIADQLGLDVWLYDERDWWAAVRTPYVDREEHTVGFGAILEGYAARLSAPLRKLTVVGLPARVEEAEGHVHAELGAEVSASRSKPRFLDITPQGWHKGAVVARFASYFGLAPARVAVIGDGPNDIEMFRRAGLTIAMGQGVDAVREEAQHITASNDDEGWARGIERFVLRNDEGKW
jgi:Cof subfamily protein (haloacid dehalogenase superfamily)